MEEVDDFVDSKHDLLVSAVSKLDKTQHITEPTRNEPTNLHSEFNLIKRSNKIDINKVAKVLQETSHHLQIRKKLKKSHNAFNVLPKPLEKPQAERIKRSTGYEKNKIKIGRWDPVVARSRTVDFVSFPLKNTSAKLQPTQDFLSKLKLKSPLEKELDEIDPPTIEESEEEEQTYPMSYEEMLEHRQQSAKLRAQQSYNAAKAKRQSKIKSKKYHRILKKEKLKQQLKEFEELQKKNPEEALQKLEALEKARALERHTLRHKNTGKWAKNKMIRAKYDKDVRQQLAEQLAVSRSLTHKIQEIQSSDDEVDNNEVIPDMTLSQDPMNPWMLQTANTSNIDTEFNFGYKKYLQTKMNKKKDDSDSESNDDDNVKDKNENSAIDISAIKDGINKVSQSESSEDVVEYIIDPTAIKRSIGNRSVTVKQAPIIKCKNIVATSNWTVEPVKDLKENVTDSISNAFESLEDNVAKKVEKKLKTLRANIESLERSSNNKNIESLGRCTKNKKENKDKEHDNLEYLKMKSQKVKAVIDEALLESGKPLSNVSDDEKSPLNIIKTLQNVSQKDTNSDIDPTRFIKVKPKYLNSALPNLDNNNDELDDDQVVPKVNIEEVFEEDDVVASFRQEKEDEINKDKPTDIDLCLPGWGAWGGKGVKAPKRKRNRFIMKAAPKMPRRDDNKGDVIIKEYKESKLGSHKVTDIPFPFTSIKEYEASIRAPIGNTFIPEKAHRKLIKPSVITKAGSIIEPMDEDELLVPKNRRLNKEVLSLSAKK